VVLQNFPKLDVGPIGEFNHWDRRECRVQNPDEWKRCRWDRFGTVLGPRKLLEDPDFGCHDAKVGQALFIMDILFKLSIIQNGKIMFFFLQCSF
jgi:hypothetical protein